MSADDALQERLKARLKALREEYALGQQRLTALDVQATELRQTLLRIAGAIQVLEEAIGDVGG